MSAHCSANPQQAAVFTIPMRGNEVGDALERLDAGAFTIPMRGNEGPSASVSRQREGVYNPHEG